MTKSRNPIICPHCKKPIRRAPKPRDLGLLLHTLTYRVPVEEEITGERIEKVRQHCRMTPERLQELRGDDYERFWRYMEDKRQRRREWMEETGDPPPYGWTPPKPGEPDHAEAVAAMGVYWKEIRPLMAKLKRRPDAQSDKLLNRYLATKKIRSRSRHIVALNDVEARLILQHKIQQGTLTMKEYRALKAHTLQDRKKKHDECI